MSLTTRIAGLAVVLVITAMAAFGLLVRAASNAAITAREGDRLIYGVSDVAIQLNEEIEKAIADVQTAASTSTVKGLVRSIENGGIDPVDAVSAAEWMKRLADNFKVMLTAEKSYLTVELIEIADDGREIVKVDRTNNGIFRVPPGDLEQRGRAAFFRNAIKQPIGTPYISEIAPEDSSGTVNTAGSPVIHVATVVTTQNGARFGIVKITIDCARLISRLLSFNDAVSKLYMTTLDGHYIINPDDKKPFGYSPGHRRRIQDDYPWLAAAFPADAAAAQGKSLTRGRFAPRLPQAEQPVAKNTAEKPSSAVYPEGKSYSDEDHVARTLCVTAGSGTSKRTWVVLGVIDTRSLVASVLGFREYLIAVVLALIVLSIIAASILARRITGPISRLTEAAKRAAEGNWDVNVQSDASADATVAELGKSFAAMQNAVRNRERRLHDARARTEAIINAAASAIIMLDEHGKIIQANAATNRLFGYPPSQLEGQQISMLAHDTYLESFFGTGGEGEIIGKPHEILAKRKNGKTFPVEISVSEVQISGAGRNFVVMLTDLSERKRYEDLENQLKLERMKGEFVSTVSHELRTPLTSIKGAMALLKSDRLVTMPAKAQALINIAYSNSERLLLLINDILDMEKIKSGKLSFYFEELDVCLLLHEAARSNAAYAEPLGVKIKVARNVAQHTIIKADPDRIAQALANLISNAAKFSPKGGCVTLSAKKMRGSVRISVADKGTGIPEEFRDRIFSRFAQADSTDARQKGGSGLGLSITKAIVEAHGGKVGFESTTGKGTTFFIDLPIVASAAECAELAQDQGAPASTSPMRPDC